MFNAPVKQKSEKRNICIEFVLYVEITVTVLN